MIPDREYDTTSDPPAPEVDAVLYRPWSLNDSLPIKLMLDTGADRTGIPLTTLVRLGARPLDWDDVVDFEGNPHRVLVWEADLQIMGLSFGRVEVTGLRAGEGFIGRDVINRFIFTLNGPAMILSIRQ